ncbi:hypothetical protein GCM10023116_44260 [Kistimonas scapharcae]|uniref:Protein kinase domain-containing protein n=1 Tax=Kistimonas scapharcae TaxID=1036133 RepID=A0ABP8VAZ5_9GAMM
MNVAGEGSRVMGGGNGQERSPLSDNKESIGRVLGSAKWHMNRLGKVVSGESHTYIRRKRGQYIFKLLNSLPIKALYEFGVEEKVVHSFFQHDSKSKALKEDYLYVGKGVSGVVKFALALNIHTGESCLCVAKKVKGIANVAWRETVTGVERECRLQSEAAEKDLAIPVYEWVDTYNKKYQRQCIIFMRLSHGVTLRNFLRVSDIACNQLAQVTRIKIVLQMIEKVQALHQCGIYHRDLKPNNIVVEVKRRDGVDQLDIKFLDFGMSTKDKYHRCGYERVLICCASEMLHEYAYSAPLDIYSLGCAIVSVINNGADFVVNDEKAEKGVTRYHDFSKVEEFRPVIIDKIKRCHLKIKNMEYFLSKVLLSEPNQRPTIDQMKVGFEQWSKESAEWT